MALRELIPEDQDLIFFLPGSMLRKRAVCTVLKEGWRGDLTRCWAAVQHSLWSAVIRVLDLGGFTVIPVHGKEGQGRVGTREEEKMAR